MKLSDLQSAFQKALIEGDDAILAHIPDSPKEKKDTLLGVYKNAYLFRLVDFLANDFERLHTYVGDAVFFKLAQDFIKAHPSHTPNARWYGKELPEFVASYEPLSKAPMAAAIAKLEGALNDVFDCADAEAVTRGDFARFAPEEFAHLTFRPHASARRFDCALNLDAVWSALLDEQPPPAPVAVTPAQKFVVWRHELSPRYRVLATEEAMLWDEMTKGVRFGVLCELLATIDDPATAAYRAAENLETWIANGLLGSVTLAADA